MMRKLEFTICYLLIILSASFPQNKPDTSFQLFIPTNLDKKSEL